MFRRRSARGPRRGPPLQAGRSGLAGAAEHHESPPAAGHDDPPSARPEEPRPTRHSPRPTRHELPPTRPLVVAVCVLAVAAVGLGLFSDVLTRHVLTLGPGRAGGPPSVGAAKGPPGLGATADEAGQPPWGTPAGEQPGPVWPPRAGSASGAGDTTELTLTFSGDLDLDPSGARAALAPLGSLLSSADLAICRGPTPTTRPEAVAEALRRVGFDACATASNRAARLGGAGVRGLLDALDGAAIDHSGTARDPLEAGTLSLLPVRGAQISLLSYTENSGTTGTTGTTPADPGAAGWTVSGLDSARILRDAARARAAGADLVVVALSWAPDQTGPDRTEPPATGPPGTPPGASAPPGTAPTQRQRATARELLHSPLVDLVVGTGTGTVRPVERVDGKYVAYGTGSITTPAADATTGAAGGGAAGRGRDGALLHARVRRTALGWMIVGLTYSPTWTGSDGAVRPVADALDDPGTTGSARAELTASWLRTVAALTSLGQVDGVRPERVPRQLGAGA